MQASPSCSLCCRQATSFRPTIACGADHLLICIVYLFAFRRKRCNHLLGTPSPGLELGTGLMIVRGFTNVGGNGLIIVFGHLMQCKLYYNPAPSLMKCETKERFATQMIV